MFHISKTQFNGDIDRCGTLCISAMVLFFSRHEVQTLMRELEWCEVRRLRRLRRREYTTQDPNFAWHVVLH